MSKIFALIKDMALKNEALQMPVPTGRIVWYRSGPDTIVEIGLDNNQVVTFRRTAGGAIHVSSTCQCLYLSTDPLNEQALRVVCNFIEGRLIKAAEELKSVSCRLHNICKDHDGQVT